jgi:iron(III) transport system ATP-binding protein
VRPEEIQLSELRPEGDNVWQGSVDQKVFLGEAVDFQVKVGSRTVQSRAHPSLRTRVGEPIFVRIDAEKCVALKATPDWTAQS